MIFSLPERVFFFVVLALAPSVFSLPRQETGKQRPVPLEAYYAGRVEEAAGGFSRSGGKTQLAVILWELGEMNKAAALLEELLKDPELRSRERAEILLELFYTYCLSNNYDRAAAIRPGAERAVQDGDSRRKADFYFFAAMSYEGTGNVQRARELYKKSLDLNKSRPVGWYRLGMLLRESDPKEAEKCFQTCWDQDNAFTGALLPLAKLLIVRKEWKKAREFLVIADGRMPGQRDIAEALEEVRKHAPGGGDQGLFLIRQQIRAVPPKVQPAPDFPKEGNIRIGLAERRRLVSVKAGGGFTLRPAGGSFLYRGQSREQIWIEWTDTGGNGLLTVLDKNGKILVRSSEPLVYILSSSHDTTIAAGVVNGSPGTHRIYRGSLEFRPRPEGMTVVNIVPMEEYLYGVIPSEMPAVWPMEALKAQTIAARSYSIANLGQFSERGFDLFGTPHSMAYHGVGTENKKTTEAVDLTRGIILKGGGEPLKAYFSANHGGYSEDSLTLWGYDAHMQAVPDKLLTPRLEYLPVDALYRWIRDAPDTYSIVPRYSYASSYRWEKWVTPEEIRRRLPEDPGEIRHIVSRGRGISGRIRELEVKGSKSSVIVKGDAIWNAMGGLRSSLFMIRYKLAPDGRIEYFVFQGAGHGHGIGLDQHGAAGMASAGFKSEEILRHYYPRAALESL